MKTISNSFKILTIITILEKLLSFLFQSIIASNYGATIVADSYFSASELFTLINETVLGALTIAVLNRFTFLSEKSSEDKAFQYISNIFSFSFVFMLVVCILIFCFADSLSVLIAPGYDLRGRTLLIRNIRLMSFVPSILAIAAVCLAVLRQKKRFEITALRSFFISTVGIACVLLKAQNENADSLCIAFLLSSILFTILVLLVTLKYGKISIHKPIVTDELRLTFYTMFPLIVSYGVTRLSLMANRIMASMLGNGAVSSLSYSHTLHNVVTAFFVTNICTILLTDFNLLYAKTDFMSLTGILIKTVRVLTLILLPVVILTAVFRIEIVSFVFERGYFNRDNTITVSTLLFVYAFNFIPAMIYNVHNQALYSFGDTKSAMRNSLVAIVINIIVSIILAYTVGLFGVAVGAVISSTIGACLSIKSVKQHLKHYQDMFSVKYLADCVFASVACFTISLILYSVVNMTGFAYWVLSCILCIFVYLIVLYIMKNDIILDYADFIKRKIGNNK